MFRPDRRNVLHIVAAVLAWLASVFFTLSVVLVGILLAEDRGAVDHGAGVLPMAGIVGSLMLFAGALGIRGLERTQVSSLRATGACLLVLGAWFCASYPLAWLRDSYSFPFVGALVFAGLTVLQLVAAWFLVRDMWRR